MDVRDFEGREALAEIAHATAPLLMCEETCGALAPHVTAYSHSAGWRVSTAGVIHGHLGLSGDGVLNRFEAMELAAVLVAGALALKAIEDAEARERKSENPS